MGHLLVQAKLTLGGVCCHDSSQLTLESQCCHLCGHGVGRVIVVFIFSQSTKHILHVGVGGSISLVAHSGRCGVQSSLERHLDHASQFDPSLVDIGKEVPRFKSPDIQTVRQRIAVSTNCLLVYGFLPRMATLAQSLIRQNRTSGTLAAKYSPQKILLLASRAVDVGLPWMLLN
jgi:hypothetical protein